MKKVLIFFSLIQMCAIFADSSPMFSLTEQEMVFASKLTDENRRKFCYQLSQAERLDCLKKAGESNSEYPLDQIVEDCGQQKSLDDPLRR